MTDHYLAEATRVALATHGIEMARPPSSIPSHPHVLSDLATVMVKLHATYDDAWREVYWARILGDGGASVVPLLSHEVVRIEGAFGVVTRYLAPDRETDERDASAAGKVMRHIHDLAFMYVEPDGTSWTPCGSQPHDFVVHQGSLYLVDLDNVERRDNSTARIGAARDFASGLPTDVAERAYAQFLSAYGTQPQPTMAPLWFADVAEGESPYVWGAIFARADRIWAWSRLDHEQTEDERRNFDAALLSPRCAYLIHHLLRLQNAAHPERFDELLARYPKLEPLRTVEPIDRPIVTSERPLYAWSYLHKVGIVR